MEAKSTFTESGQYHYHRDKAHLGEKIQALHLQMNFPNGDITKLYYDVPKDRNELAMTRNHMLHYLAEGTHIGLDRPAQDPNYIWQVRVWRENVSGRYLELLQPGELPSQAAQDKMDFPYRVRVSELHRRVIAEERYVENDDDSHTLREAKLATLDELDAYLLNLGLTHADLLPGWHLSMI